MNKEDKFIISLFFVIVVLFLWIGLGGVHQRLDKLIELCTFEEESEQIIFQIDPKELSVL